MSDSCYIVVRFSLSPLDPEISYDLQTQFTRFVLLVTVIGTHETLACTTFCLKNKGEVLFGKNYDWMIGDGMIFVNKRGVSKMSAAEKNPARWNSKYGSITFNQYGREAPSGGMNEAGLVIELMWLDDTRYPQPDSRAEVDVLEWIQYNLDTAASVADVIKSSEAITDLLARQTALPDKRPRRQFRDDRISGRQTRSSHR